MMKELANQDISSYLGIRDDKKSLFVMCKWVNVSHNRSNQYLIKFGVANSWVQNLSVKMAQTMSK